MSEGQGKALDVEFLNVEYAEELLVKIEALDRRIDELQPDYDAMKPEASVEFMSTVDEQAELDHEYFVLTGRTAWIEVESRKAAREAAKKAVLD